MTTIVRVERNDADKPASIYARGRTGAVVLKARQHLTPDTRAALGDDRAAYFEARDVAGTWFVGRRLPAPREAW